MRNSVVIPVINTLGDIFKLSKYQRTLMNEIKEIGFARSRSKQTLKRNAFVVLDEQGKLCLPYLNEEYMKIQNKESLHTASERELIIALVEGAIHETLKWIEELKQQSIKEVEPNVPVVEKPKRKPRAKKEKDE